MTSTQKVNKTSVLYNKIQDFAPVSPESPQTKLVKNIKNENNCKILRQDLSTQKLVQLGQELPAFIWNREIAVSGKTK